MDLEQLKTRIADGEPVHPGMVRSAARKLERAGDQEQADALVASIAAGTVAEVAASIE